MKICEYYTYLKNRSKLSGILIQVEGRNNVVCVATRKVAGRIAWWSIK